MRARAERGNTGPMKKRDLRPLGPSQRQLRVGELVRRSVTDVLLRGDLFDPDLAGASIVVTEARPSPDLRHVTVFISVLGGKNEEKILASLRRHAPQLRRAATEGINLKYSPQLHFQLDGVYDQMDATNRLFADPKVQQDLRKSSDADDDDWDDDGDSGSDRGDGGE